MKKCLNKKCVGFDDAAHDNCVKFFNSEKCNKKGLKAKHYDFKVNHPEMIDRSEIYKSISRKNPLLFFEINDQIQVFLHRSIRIKARILNLNILQPKTDIFNTNEKHLKAEWIEWVKMVKTARWGKLKDVQKVKFIYPKI